ncbi:hypothetical protein AB4505_13550 [Vibrio splendidus]
MKISLVAIMIISLNCGVAYALPPNNVCQGAITLGPEKISYLDQITTGESYVEKNIKILTKGIKSTFDYHEGPCSYYAQSVYAALKYGISDLPTSIYRLHSRAFSNFKGGRYTEQILGSIAYRYKKGIKFEGVRLDKHVVDGLAKEYGDAVSSGPISHQEYLNRIQKNAHFTTDRYYRTIESSNKVISKLKDYEPAIISYEAKNKITGNRRGHALVIVKLPHDRLLMINNGRVMGGVKAENLKVHLLKNITDIPGEGSLYKLGSVEVISS